MLAAIIKRRLMDAGAAEDRITQGHFGFWNGLSMQDGTFVLRRHVKSAWAKAKAFASLDPLAIIDALRRIGVPTRVLNLIRAIYTDRRFTARDFVGFSTERARHFGISQGCPLSPFLFVMVMIIVLEDAIQGSLAPGKNLRVLGKLDELLR